jgi:hypothetical protein
MNPFVDGLHQFFGDLILESIEVRRSVRPLWQRQTLDHALTISCGGSSTAARVVGATDGVRVEASASTGGRVSTSSSDEKLTQDCQQSR